jgi:hypothetical protein
MPARDLIHLHALSHSRKLQCFSCALLYLEMLLLKLVMVMLLLLLAGADDAAVAAAA